MSAHVAENVATQATQATQANGVDAITMALNDTSLNGATVTNTPEAVNEATNGATASTTTATAATNGTAENAPVDTAAEARPRPQEAVLTVRTIRVRKPTDNGNLGGDESDIPVVAYGEDKGYTATTPPGEFPGWVAYTTYCNNGPFITVQCAKDFVDGRCVSFCEVKVSEKLWCDHSGYFKALMKGTWCEAKTRVLRLPDVHIDDFMRLHLTLLGGGVASRMSLGKPTSFLQDLTECYIHADYFKMAAVMGWLKGFLADYLNEMRGWSALYVNQILDESATNISLGNDPPTHITIHNNNNNNYHNHHPHHDHDHVNVNTTKAAEEAHQEKVDDFSNAYIRLRKLLPTQQIINHEELVRFLVYNCPRPLLASSIGRIDKKFKDHIFNVYLLL